VAGVEEVVEAVRDGDWDQYLCEKIVLLENVKK